MTGQAHPPIANDGIVPDAGSLPHNQTVHLLRAIAVELRVANDLAARNDPGMVNVEELRVAAVKEIG